MPFALLALTEDLLHKIAAIVGAPDVVVACCHHQSRDAVRRGVDEAERRRFGLGRTVREAEGLLRGDFSLSRDAYSTRRAAGEFLLEHLDANHLTEPDYDLETCLTLLAFGADVTVAMANVGHTSLHCVAVSGHANAVEIARHLVDAGADPDAQCVAGHHAGCAPVAWCICPTLDVSPEQTPEAVVKGIYRYRVALALIERGADWRQAEAAYLAMRNSNRQQPWTFKAILTLNLARRRTNIIPELGETFVNTIHALLRVIDPDAPLRDLGA